MTFLRSLLFFLGLIAVTPPYSIVALAAFPLPAQARWRVISGWARIILWLARAVAGISFRVEGLENMPKLPAIILSKHQSAWETLAFQVIFPPQVQVLKRELLWIPFFGWGLALMSPIAIDRSRGTGALRRMAERGAQRIAQGFWIVIFPEGTRVSPRERSKYHAGGAWLACKLGTPVVPVAHNAGLYWGKNHFIKRAGEIRVQIGEPIHPAELSPAALNAKVEEWIEQRMADLCPA